MYLILTIIVILYILAKNRFPWSEVIVLNLERRLEKFYTTKSQLLKHNITNIIRWEAVDGSTLKNYENYLHPNFQIYKWDARKRGAVGNYLSFIQIHNHIVDKNNYLTLILEDDIVLDDNFTKNFYLMWNLIKDDDWDLIYLGISNVTISKTKDKWIFYKKINDTFSLYTPYAENGELYGNFGLLIKPIVSKTWLQNSLPITQASDSKLGSLVCGKKISVDNPSKIQSIPKELKALVIYPPLITYTFYISDTSF